MSCNYRNIPLVDIPLMWFNQKVSNKFYKVGNGYSPKKLKSEYGEVQLQIPRDHNGEFEPKVIPKYQRNVPGIGKKLFPCTQRVCLLVTSKSKF